MSAVNPQNPNNDIIVPNSPTDTISCISWSPTGNFFAASSWNKEVTCYEVNTQQGQTALRGKQSHNAPILSCVWSADGQRVFTGGCDSVAKMWNLATNQSQVVAQHAAPIREVVWSSTLNMLVTGSWDKTVKYWDLRQQQPAASVQMNDRVYTMACRGPVLVVGTGALPPVGNANNTATAANANNLFVYNLSNASGIQQPFRTGGMVLKHAPHCSTIFPDNMCYAIGTTEGRVAIQYVQDKDQALNFAFRCHRDVQGDKSDVYGVNTMTASPTGTFMTAGGDCRMTSWDKNAKQRIKQYEKMLNPITASGFNTQGNIYAYAVGYDWAKGIEQAASKKQPCGILLHSIQGDEMLPKKNN